jgi:tetratricopeptide (TPR) repeat protein
MNAPPPHASAQRPLILHIGLSKTGSSSIQRVLAEQRPAMRAQGAYLPLSPGWANHALLPAACVSDTKILWGYHPGTWEGLTIPVRLARFRDEFAAEMDALPDDVTRVVITAEQLGGVLRLDEEVERLAELLRRWFDPIQVVVYLRRQDQHAASAYSEWLRGGVLREPGLPAGGPEQHPEYDYGGLLDRWARAFGAQAMVPRIFDRARLKGGDVVEDFLALAEMTLPALEENAKRQSNPSINVAGQKLLLAAGRRMAARAGQTVWRDTPAWRRLAELSTEAFAGRGWRPTRGEARAFLARFEATNERARARFFPDQPSLFDRDFSELPEVARTEPDSIVADAAIDALLHEVDASARREAQAAMTQYRLNRRLADRPGMRACLVRAVKFAPDMLAARLRLAEFFVEEGDLRQARQHAEVALRLAPDDPAAQRLDRQTKAKKVLS